MALLGALLGIPGFAFAGPTGTEFLALYTWINGVVTGYLGRAIAMASLALRAPISFPPFNPIPILVGIGFAIFLQYTPTIITGILTATI